MPHTKYKTIDGIETMCISKSPWQRLSDRRQLDIDPTLSRQIDI